VTKRSLTTLCEQYRKVQLQIAKEGELHFATRICKLPTRFCTLQQKVGEVQGGTPPQISDYKRGVRIWGGRYKKGMFGTA